METFDETPFDETDLALWGIGKREQLALGLRRGGGYSEQQCTVH